MKRLLVLLVVLAVVAVGSVAVWGLIDDDTRLIGAVSASSEPVALSWRGPWSSTAKYSVGQVVSQKGSSYVAETAHTGVDPSKPCAADCAWSLLAAKGEQGTPGPRGPSELRVRLESGTRALEPWPEQRMVGSLVVQPGDYVVEASMRAVVPGAPSYPWSIECALRTGDAATGPVADSTRMAVIDAAERPRIRLVDYAKLGAQTTYKVWCWESAATPQGTPEPYLQQIRLQALRLETLTIEIP